MQDAECRDDIAYLAPHLPLNAVRDYLDKGRFDEKQFQGALAQKFVETIKQMQGRERSTYCRFTCALDTKMMEGLFSTIKDDFINHSITNLFAL